MGCTLKVRNNEFDKILNNYLIYVNVETDDVIKVLKSLYWKIDYTTSRGLVITPHDLEKSLNDHLSGFNNDKIISICDVLSCYLYPITEVISSVLNTQLKSYYDNDSWDVDDSGAFLVLSRRNKTEEVFSSTEVHYALRKKDFYLPCFVEHQNKKKK